MARDDYADELRYRLDCVVVYASLTLDERELRDWIREDCCLNGSL